VWRLTVIFSSIPRRPGSHPRPLLDGAEDLKPRGDERSLDSLSFARRESCVASVQRRLFLSFQPFCPIKCDCRLDSAQQLFVAEGFRQEYRFGVRTVHLDGCVGIFELFEAIFEELFKHKAEYSLRMLLPTLPARPGLFWASVFGDLPPKMRTSFDVAMPR
jgi:hypothetical protein